MENKDAPVQLKIRFPDGSVTENNLSESDTLSTVLLIAESHMGEKNILLSIPHPRKIFSSKDMETTLKHAGLAPRGMLIVQRGIATDMKQDTTPVVLPGVKHIHSEAEYKKWKSTPNKLVIVDFSATWCGPCQQIAPVYEKLAQTYKNAIFLHVDVDENRGLADGSDVEGIPTFKFFKNNKPACENVVGADTNKLEAKIKAHV